MPELTALCAVMSVSVWFVSTCNPSNLCGRELVHGVVPEGGVGEGWALEGVPQVLT